MWKIKVLIQFLLANLPGGMRINYFLQKFRGAHSEEKINQLLPNRIRKLKLIDGFINIDGSSILEIGPGSWMTTNLLFYIMGAKKIFSYDHYNHAQFKIIMMQIKWLEENVKLVESMTNISESIICKRISKIKSSSTLDEFFKNANIIYNAPGDARQTGLPNDSIDIVFSCDVLEHVPEKTINKITIESKRILKSSGCAFHHLGLDDHYSYVSNVSKVNFLKYPEWLWRLFVKNKISYHNRLREKEFFKIFKSCGSKVEVVFNKIDPNSLVTLKSMKINKRFSGMSHEELAVWVSFVRLTF